MPFPGRPGGRLLRDAARPTRLLPADGRGGVPVGERLLVRGRGRQLRFLSPALGRQRSEHRLRSRGSRGDGHGELSGQHLRGTGDRSDGHLPAQREAQAPGCDSHDRTRRQPSPLQRDRSPQPVLRQVPLLGRDLPRRTLGRTPGLSQGPASRLARRLRPGERRLTARHGGYPALGRGRPDRHRTIRGG